MKKVLFALTLSASPAIASGIEECTKQNALMICHKLQEGPLIYSELDSCLEVEMTACQAVEEAQKAWRDQGSESDFDQIGDCVISSSTPYSYYTALGCFLAQRDTIYQAFLAENQIEPSAFVEAACFKYASGREQILQCLDAYKGRFEPTGPAD